MEVKKLPVYMFSYRKSYYLTHPWKLVRDVWSGMRNLWHRARYGYAYVDAWNMGSAWCEMGANMMLHLAQHCWAYPGVGEFDTPEKWKAHLEEMARKLRQCADIDWDDQNEFQEQFLENPNDKELQEKYFSRMHWLMEKRDNLIKDTFETIGKNFDMYWD